MGDPSWSRGDWVGRAHGGYHQIQQFLEETDIDSDDDLENTGDCTNCHHKPEKGVELKKCSRCRVAQYCSVNCQKADWAFHRFACGVVAKRATTTKL